MAEALLWNRFAELPLSEEEKGRIYAELQDADLHQLQKMLPDFLGDEAVASSLRERYLKSRPPEGSTKRTPSKEKFIKLLQEKKLPKGSRREDIIDWMKELPISDSTKQFLECNLHTVAEKMYVKATLGGMAQLPAIIRRLDYKQVLKSKANAKVLILSGIRRQGKTCALPMELVHARNEKFGVQDKTIFYYAGDHNSVDDIRPSSLITAILVLAYAGIAACWDEFQCSVEELGKAYKFLLEQDVDVDPLSVVMWGSSEPQVQEKAGTLVSGLQSRGSFHFALPDPSIEVLIGIYYLSKGLYEKELSSSELLETWNSKDFLKRFTVCGYNLEAHMALGGKEVELEDYKGRLETGLNNYGRWGSVLMKLILNGGDCSNVSSDDLFGLQRRNYIKEDPQNKKRVEFMKPEVIMYSTLINYGESITVDNCADAEGRAFELLVRGENLLLPQLLKIIAEKGALKDEIPNMDMDKFLAQGKKMNHGSISKDCEIDGFFFFETVFVALSMKRSIAGQNMEQMLNVLYSLKRYIERDSGATRPGWQLLKPCTKQILVVEVSAIGERIIPAMKEHMFNGKPVKQISITLKELVASISPEMINI